MSQRIVIWKNKLLTFPKTLFHRTTDLERAPYTMLGSFFRPAMQMVMLSSAGSPVLAAQGGRAMSAAADKIVVEVSTFLEEERMILLTSSPSSFHAMRANEKL